MGQPVKAVKLGELGEVGVLDRRYVQTVDAVEYVGVRSRVVARVRVERGRVLSEDEDFQRKKDWITASLYSGAPEGPTAARSLDARRMR